MQATAIHQTPATRWHSWRHKTKPALYLDAVKGEGRSNTGEPFTCSPGLGARNLIESIPGGIEVVYLCGELPASPQVKTQDAQLYSPFNSWVIGSDPESMYLDSGTSHDATLAVVQRSNGQEVELRVIANWTGTNDLTPEQVHETLTFVTNKLRAQPNWPEVCLLKTATITGQELWRHTIGISKQPDGTFRSVEYPLLPEDVRDLIHRTSGQGRFEMLPCPNSSGMAPEIFYLDDRLAYIARASTELGIGPATHDWGSKYEGFTPARYRVAFQVPEGWSHVGLLPMQRPIQRGAEAIGLEFPRTPLSTGDTWVDGVELRVAFAPFPHSCPICSELYRKNDGKSCPEHGWNIQILERIIFTPGRPLRTWAEKLLEVWEQCSGMPAAQAVVRNLVLHAIGGFHGSHKPITRIAQDYHSTPDGEPLQIVLDVSGQERYLWAEAKAVIPRHQDYSRPEWSSGIWSRERARLLLYRDYGGNFTGALTLPFEQIVAFRLDALYVTTNPGWPDIGKPGQMRLKGHLPGPVAWPKEETDLARIKKQLEGSRH